MSNHTVDENIIDLEIRIFPSDARVAGYPVEITLGGQQEFTGGRLAADVLPWVPSADPVSDGQRLFEALFADDVLRNALAEARGRARQRRIRLWLDTNAPELHALPWELLREGDTMLATDANTPFSRYLPVPDPWGSAVEERPIRVLVAISSPRDLQDYNLAQLDVELERSILEQAFSVLDEDEIRLDFLDAPVTLERLEAWLREGYHVLHYVGHGFFNQDRQQTVLYLQNEESDTRGVRDEEFVSMLSHQRVRPRLIFLAACQSATRSTADAFLGLAPKLVGAGVPAVVAMQDKVAIKTAQKLSQIFYRRLAEHGIVDRAMNEARNTLLTVGRPDAAVPVLFMRLQSGHLWAGDDRALEDRITYIMQQALSKAGEARQRQAFIEETLFNAVAEYASGVRKRLAQETEEPYPGLYSYELTDRSRFFGRTVAVQELLASIQGVARRRHLIVFHGASGTGKTSVLRAGLAPRLLMEGHLPVRVEVRDTSPAEALKRNLIPTLDQFAELRDMPLNAFLRLVQSALGPDETVFVFWDQFEEFFLSRGLDETERQRFVSELGTCLDDEVLNVHFLISIRDDQFARLNDFKRQRMIPWIIDQDNVYTLRPLSAMEAEEVLVAPIRQQGLIYEEGLVQEIVKDIGGQNILPAQLQLVCRALYKSLETGQTMITRHHYQSQGRVRGIIQNHLARVLSEIETRLPIVAMGDQPDISMRDLANYTLVSLVERVPTTRRRQRTLADLLTDARVDESLLQSILEELVRERLVQVIGAEVGGEAAYMLAHDSLIEQIAHDREIAALQNVRDLLEAELDFHQKHGTVMSLERLAIVEALGEKLRLDVDALDLLFRSALAHKRSLAPWRNYAVHYSSTAELAPLTRELADRWTTIIEMVETDEPAADTAVRLLANLSDAEAVSRLGALIVSSAQDGQEVSLYHLSPVQRKALIALAQMECPEAEAYLRKLTPDGFCFVPAGSFEMGSDEEQDERPRHSVWLPAFWIARSPATVADWKRFVESGGYAQPRYWASMGDSGMGRNILPAGWQDQQQREDHPVRNLTWYEAMAYADWLAETSGVPVALPTEAEWEKAAGWDHEAGQKRRHPWGDTPDETRCNVQKPGAGNTTPPGQYSPAGDSPCGAQDMAGNVLEWTRTEYRPYPYDADNGRREALAGDQPRVLRGGAFNRSIEDTRCARRHLLDPAIGLSSTGCRVCLRLVPLIADGKQDERSASDPTPG